MSNSHFTSLKVEDDEGHGEDESFEGFHQTTIDKFVVRARRSLVHYDQLINKIVNDEVDIDTVEHTSIPNEDERRLSEPDEQQKRRYPKRSIVQKTNLREVNSCNNHNSQSPEKTMKRNNKPVKSMKEIQSKSVSKVTKGRVPSRKRFSCSQCPYEGKDAWSLRRHTFTHSQLRKYACDSCDYKSVSPYNLEKHKKYHCSSKV